MVGSVILLLPINFGSTGIVLSVIIMAIIGFLACKTCTWVIKNSLPGEKSFRDVVYRILGEKFLKIFSLVSFSLLTVVGIVMFLLINSSFYQIMKFIMLKLDISMAPQDEISFSQYSI